MLDFLNHLLLLGTYFTPAETAACTGLSLTLQRDWRSLGHLPALHGSDARFSPLELAMMQEMVRLRRRGLTPAACREIAEEAAPSVLYFALDDRKKGLTVEPNDARGERYFDTLVRETDQGFRESMLGIPQVGLKHYILMPDDDPVEFISDLGEISLDDAAEDSAYVSLSAVALKTDLLLKSWTDLS